LATRIILLLASGEPGMIQRYPLITTRLGGEFFDHRCNA